MACSAGWSGLHGLTMSDIVFYEKRILGQSPSLAFFHLEGAPVLSEKWNQGSYIYILFDTKCYNIDSSGLWFLLFIFTVHNNVTQGSSLSDLGDCSLIIHRVLILYLFELGENNVIKWFLRKLWSFLVITPWTFSITHQKDYSCLCNLYISHVHLKNSRQRG